MLQLKMEFHSNNLRYNQKEKFHESEKTFNWRTKGFNIERTS